MADTDDNSTDQQRLTHSLPGTNQAGRGATRKDGTEPATDPRQDQPHDQIESHSLPGTNQAGKGARPKGE